MSRKRDADDTTSTPRGEDPEDVYVELDDNCWTTAGSIQDVWRAAQAHRAAGHRVMIEHHIMVCLTCKRTHVPFIMSEAGAT